MPARIAAVAAVALLAAAPAPHAQQTDAPRVEVKLDPGGATVVRASIDIDAPPRVVWRILHDCDKAMKLVKEMRSCKVLWRDPQGRWDVREHVIKPMIFSEVRSITRAEYDPPKALEFNQLEGDVKEQRGYWRLEPLDGGEGSRVFYENRVVLGLPIAGPIFRAAIRAATPDSMIRLRKMSEQDAREVAATPVPERAPPSAGPLA